MKKSYREIFIEPGDGALEWIPPPHLSAVSRLLRFLRPGPALTSVCEQLPFGVELRVTGIQYSRGLRQSTHFQRLARKIKGLELCKLRGEAGAVRDQASHRRKQGRSGSPRMSGQGTPPGSPQLRGPGRGTPPGFRRGSSGTPPGSPRPRSKPTPPPKPPKPKPAPKPKPPQATARPSSGEPPTKPAQKSAYPPNTLPKPAKRQLTPRSNHSSDVTNSLTSSPDDLTLTSSTERLTSSPDASVTSSKSLVSAVIEKLNAESLNNTKTGPLQVPHRGSKVVLNGAKETNKKSNNATRDSGAGSSNSPRHSPFFPASSPNRCSSPTVPLTDIPKVTPVPIVNSAPRSPEVVPYAVVPIPPDADDYDFCELTNSSPKDPETESIKYEPVELTNNNNVDTSIVNNNNEIKQNLKDDQCNSPNSSQVQISTSPQSVVKLNAPRTLNIPRRREVTLSTFGKSPEAHEIGIEWTPPSLPERNIGDGIKRTPPLPAPRKRSVLTSAGSTESDCVFEPSSPGKFSPSARTPPPPPVRQSSLSHSPSLTSSPTPPSRLFPSCLARQGSLDDLLPYTPTVENAQNDAQNDGRSKVPKNAEPGFDVAVLRATNVVNLSEGSDSFAQSNPELNTDCSIYYSAPAEENSYDIFSYSDPSSSSGDATFSNLNQKKPPCEENYYSPVQQQKGTDVDSDEDHYYSPVQVGAQLKTPDSDDEPEGFYSPVEVGPQKPTVEVATASDAVPLRPPRNQRRSSKILFDDDGTVKAVPLTEDEKRSSGTSQKSVNFENTRPKSDCSGSGHIPPIRSQSEGQVTAPKRESAELKERRSHTQSYPGIMDPELEEEYVCLWRDQNSVQESRNSIEAAPPPLPEREFIPGVKTTRSQSLATSTPLQRPAPFLRSLTCGEIPPVVPPREGAGAPPPIPARNRRVSESKPFPLSVIPTPMGVPPGSPIANPSPISLNSRPPLPTPISPDDLIRPQALYKDGYIVPVSQAGEAQYSYVPFQAQHSPLAKTPSNPSNNVYESVGSAEGTSGTCQTTPQHKASDYSEIPNNDDTDLRFSMRTDDSYSDTYSDSLSEGYVRPGMHSLLSQSDSLKSGNYFDMSEQTKKSSMLLDKLGLEKESLTGTGSDIYVVNEHTEYNQDESMNESMWLNSTDESSDSESEREGEEAETDSPAHGRAYHIAREIITSEEVFVDVLKLMNEDFRAEVADVTEKVGRTIIPTLTLNQIFHYLPQLQDFSQELLRDLTERFDNWSSNPKIADVFVKKGPFLKLYCSYIKDFEQMTHLFDDSLKKYRIFADLVRDFEKSSRCANLALKHYMLKPIQRIPQYKLLLQDYHAHIEKDSPDYEDTVQALEIVTRVADHANESMREGDNFHKLLEIQNSLIGQFEVVKPGRILVKKGLLQKLSRKDSHPRMLFLFSDVLLYTIPSTTSASYRLVHVLSLAGMKITTPSVDEFETEFSVISIQRSFTVSAGMSCFKWLEASSPEERDEWVEILNRTIADNAVKRSTFEVAKTNPESIVEKDFKLGEKAPVWVPDARVTMCMSCTSEFTVTWRRHHCRACGRVVCGVCSDYAAPLQFLSFRAARVCRDCYTQLQKEYCVDDPSPGTSRVSLASDDGESTVKRSKLRSRFRAGRRQKTVARNVSKGGRARPSVLKEVHANDAGSDMSGYMKMWKVKRWKKYWFVVKDKVLYKYRASEDSAAIDSRPLLGYDIEIFTNSFESIDPGLLFKLEHPGTDAVVLRTDNTATREKWITAIQSATVA